MLWYLKWHKWAGRYGDGISLVLLTDIFCQHCIPHSTVSFYQNPTENTYYIKKRQRREGMVERLCLTALNGSNPHSHSFSLQLWDTTSCGNSQRNLAFAFSSATGWKHGRGGESNEANKAGWTFALLSQNAFQETEKMCLMACADQICVCFSPGQHEGVQVWLLASPCP